jgi:hypothetical protein
MTMNDSGPDGPSKTLLEQLPFPAHIEHAYTPRETALYGGANHVVVEQEVQVGRIHRSERDALCKRRDRFWGLYRGGEDHVPSCRRCIEIAERVIADPASVRTSAGVSP